MRIKFRVKKQRQLLTVGTENKFLKIGKFLSIVHIFLVKGLSPSYHLGGNHNEIFVLPYSNFGDSWRFELVICSVRLQRS